MSGLGSFGAERLGRPRSGGFRDWVRLAFVWGAGLASAADGRFGLSEDMSADPIIEHGASAAAGKLFIFS
jgi:hypothetical protein